MSMDSFLCDINKLGLQAKALGLLSNGFHLFETTCVQETTFCAPNQGSFWASQQDEEMQIKNSQPGLEEVDSRSKLAGEKGHMPKE